MSDKYWGAKCPQCGWRGSSQLCAGGGAIADTGDFSDVICPECFKKDRFVPVLDDDSVFAGRVLIVGFGSIGRAIVPILEREFGIRSSQITAIAADNENQAAADLMGVNLIVDPLSPSNYQDVLSRWLVDGDMLLNLSVNVSSIDLIKWCQKRGVLYLDTCVEPWGFHGIDGYGMTDSTTNFALRKKALGLNDDEKKTTAVIAHGMNPGIISYLLRDALDVIAKQYGFDMTGTEGLSRDERRGKHSQLAKVADISKIIFVEKDTQDDGKPFVPSVFQNTWSARGFCSESWIQDVETCVGRGNFYDTGVVLPIEDDIVFDKGLKRDVAMMPGGVADGFVITHHEVVSTAALFGDERRPEIRFVYQACDKAMDSIEYLSDGGQIKSYAVMDPQTLSGNDELGVLIYFNGGILWHGVKLDVEDARKIAPFNGATSLQVVGGIAGAIAWMMKNPVAGVVEAEDMDSQTVMSVASKYLGVRRNFL